MAAETTKRKNKDMKKNETAREPSNHRAISPNTNEILYDFNWACKMLTKVWLGLFVVLSLGAVFLGW